MGFYDRHILPRLIHFACGLEDISIQRKKVVPWASGTVLEIGVGSGLNFPFYTRSQVKHIVGLDPSSEMQRIAQKSLSLSDLPLSWVKASAEDIPLPDQSVDTVLVTYTLCTIPNVRAALREMRRVLTAGGELIFCEHGLSKEEDVIRWQNRVDPVWGCFAGGCHLNRDIPQLIEQAGFQIKTLDHFYIPGWKPACFNYVGRAG